VKDVEVVIEEEEEVDHLFSAQNPEINQTQASSLSIPHVSSVSNPHRI
jgi:hypothetical protein